MFLSNTTKTYETVWEGHLRKYLQRSASSFWIHQTLLSPFLLFNAIVCNNVLYKQKKTVQMIKESVIALETAEYSSSIIYVFKKDRCLRLCIDYRLLNDYKIKASYLIVIFNATIDPVSKTKRFLAIDISLATGNFGYTEMIVTKPLLPKITAVLLLKNTVWMETLSCYFRKQWI